MIRPCGPAAWLGAVLLASCATRSPVAGPGTVGGPPLETARAHAPEADEARLARLRRAVLADPTAVRPHLAYVAALLDLGRGSEAREWYAARAARPQATLLERTLAERLATDGSSSALRRVYAGAAAREPASPWWPLALAEVEVAEAEAWAANAGAATARGDRQGAGKAEQQARAAAWRAQVALDQAGRLGPQLAEVDLVHGYLRLVEGDLAGERREAQAAWQAAAASFARAAARDAGLVPAWEGLGDAGLRTGDLSRSLAAYEEAARRSPDDARLRLAVGTVLQRIGRYDEAAVQYGEAAVLAPHDAQARLRAGDALADGGHGEQALAAYDDTLRRDGSAVEAHYKRGAVLEHLGRRREALAAYERYVAQGGERDALARRRLERLLRAEATAAR